VSRVIQESKVSTRRQGSGRPRDPDVENRAYQAARAIYGEFGKTQVTFSNVAAQAGVGKPALYRRWESPMDLLIDALRAIPMPHRIPDLGDAQAELAAYARELMRVYVSPDGAALMRVTTEFHDENETFRQWAIETSEGMIALADTVIDRAVARGEAPPPVPARAVMEAITGGMLAHTVTRLHAGQLPPEHEVAEYCWQLAGLVLGRVDKAPQRPPDVTAAQPKPEGRRAELIRIAQALVTERGFSDLTLSSVATAAGLTTPALYTHFASRTDLLEQVLEATAAYYLDDLHSTDDPDASVDVRLRTRLHRWTATPAARLRVIHDAVLHIPESPRIGAAARCARAAWDDFVRDVLTRGVKRGEVRADLDIDSAVELLTGSLFGVEVGFDTGLSERAIGEMVDELVNMFLAYICAEKSSA
jgi:AcrR family transcriptional regulator